MVEYAQPQSEFENEMAPVRGAQGADAGQERAVARSKPPKRPLVKRKLDKSQAQKNTEQKRLRERKEKAPSRHVYSPSPPSAHLASCKINIREGGEAASLHSPQIESLTSPGKGIIVEKLRESEEFALAIKKVIAKHNDRRFGLVFHRYGKSFILLSSRFRGKWKCSQTRSYP